MYIYIIPHIHTCITRQHKSVQRVLDTSSTLVKLAHTTRALAHEECVTAVRVTETSMRERERESGRESEREKGQERT